MLGSTPGPAAERLSVTREEDGLTVYADGEVFVRYLKRSGSRPVLWPVIGPTGAPLTRGFPMADLATGESDDHPHHRSIWVGYEGLNGVDFWHEGPAGPHRGEVRHRDFRRVESDDAGVTVVATNDWLGPDGRPVCRDVRVVRFGADDDGRTIDFSIEIRPAGETLVVNDTKEGFFGVRVAGTMKEDAGLGGRFVTSAGLAGSAAWGRPADWVDYSGPVADGEAGVAVFAHPDNPRPTRWHVRSYGLFAANPLGEAAFGPNPPAGRVAMVLEEGRSLRFRYLVLLHAGRGDADRLADVYRRFAQRD